MLRSRTVNTIHDLSAQGKSIKGIAQTLCISRNTVHKYLRHPEAVIAKSRPPRPSKYGSNLEDHCTNCEVMLVRLQELGYTGGISILKEFVHQLRPAVGGHVPVKRYETKPGEQVQFDWGGYLRVGGALAQVLRLASYLLILRI
jgi:transposase